MNVVALRRAAAVLWFHSLTFSFRALTQPEKIPSLSLLRLRIKISLLLCPKKHNVLEISIAHWFQGLLPDPAALGSVPSIPKIYFQSKNYQRCGG